MTQVMFVSVILQDVKKYNYFLIKDFAINPKWTIGPVVHLKQ